jgi:hypothetical protein
MADIERHGRVTEAKRHQHAEGAADATHLPRPDVEGGDAAPAAAAAQARHEMIAARAYFLAEARGFACGCEMSDWLRAETEIDARAPQARPHSETRAAGSPPRREGGGGHGIANPGGKARQVAEATEHRARGAGLSSRSVLAAKPGP